MTEQIKDVEPKESTEVSNSEGERMGIYETFLHHQYRKCMQTILNGQCDYDLWNTIKLSYKERPYYNLSYLFGLMKANMQYESEKKLEFNPHAVMAIFLHKVGGPNGNARNNSQYAENTLRGAYSWLLVHTQCVKAMIGSTALLNGHNTANHMLMHDIMLSRLGVNYDRFMDNQRLCATEIRSDCELDFYRKQYLVFSELKVKSDGELFFIDYFKERYTHNAKKNIFLWCDNLKSRIKTLMAQQSLHDELEASESEQCYSG